MGDPLVLPKFELPGDKPHWAVRVAWITGAVLLVSVVGLTAVIMHRRSLEAEAQIAKIEAIARVKAEAQAKVDAAIAAANAAREQRELAAAAALAQKRAAAQAVAANTVGTSTGDPNAPSDGKGDKAASKGHRSHAGHGSKGTKVASKPGGKVDSGKSSSGKSAANKPDPIDEMLKKMK